MAYSPSHKNAASMSTTNLAPPMTSADVRQRRMSLPPPSPLNLPEPVYGHRRPPSPLRNATTIDPLTGEISDDASTHQSEAESREGRQWGQRTHSPSPSVVKFAANIAQRVGSLVSSSMNPSPRSHTLPTDDELEAEAEREREKSRREAERIMQLEAEGARTVEERVLAMLQSSPQILPPPPSRSQTMPATPPSPSSQNDGSSWWSAAKNKLTPTKDPLTPAQQVILEAKAREKEQEKEKKRSSKLKQKSKEWPSVPENKFEDPSFITLGMAASSTSVPPRPVSATPSSPTPHRHGVPGTPPSLAASPMRSLDLGSSSPSRAAPPLYAQFNAQGTLDVPGTLLTIVKRFEKLEKWTVGHVRALEERMDDVERWLVEKEKEKEREQANGKASESGDETVEGAMSEVREELAELQGRFGELGREMAKLLTSPGNLSSGPSRNAAAIARAPSTTSAVAVRSISQNITISPTSTPPKMRASISPPPVSAPALSSRTPRTRLPYPTGDYATPPDSTMLGQGASLYQLVSHGPATHDLAWC
ncbi:predicted protein [Postia placenta Mad-698-R]|nr:predicted protein [Postia placenta Mad-698-R]